MDSSRGMDSMGSKSNQSLCYYLHVQVILQLRGFIACGSSCTRPEEDIRNGSKKHGVTAVNLLTEVLEERHVIGRPRDQIGVVCSTKDCFQCAVLGQPYDIEETEVPRSTGTVKQLVVNRNHPFSSCAFCHWHAFRIELCSGHNTFVMCCTYWHWKLRIRKYEIFREKLLAVMPKKA